MTVDELIERLAHPEDRFVERKPQSVNAADIRRTIVAFANSVPEGREAVLFIGVRDNGEIEGCVNSDEKQRAVRTALRECYPPLEFQSEVLIAQGKHVVAIVVAHSKERPHFAGAAYVRQGSETVAASKALFDEMVASKNSATAALLELRGKVISVQHGLGDTKRDPNASYRERADWRIVDCDAHKVRLQDLGSGRYLTEPLQNVRISHDEERHRPMLVVSRW